MLESFDPGRLFLALSVCVGLIVAGVGNVLLGSRRAGGSLPFAAAGVGTAAGVAWLFESPMAPRVAGVGVAGLVVIALSESGRVWRTLAAVATPFHSARARWAAVAVAGVAGLGVELFRYERANAAAVEASMDDLAVMTETSAAQTVSGVQLYTDAGTAIAALAAETPLSPDRLRRIESHVFSGAPGRIQAISRGPASGESNCHGWVFTGGRYGIRGRDVPAILAENGYARVSDPVPGDACVYRGANGEVTHTAVVRAVLSDGTVLVEGKWGWLGVYLHPVAASCYGTDFHYYRTTRTSHLLTAVTAPPATSAGKAGP